MSQKLTLNSAVNSSTLSFHCNETGISRHSDKPEASRI